MEKDARPTGVLMSENDRLQTWSVGLRSAPSTFVGCSAWDLKFGLNPDIDVSIGHVLHLRNPLGVLAYFNIDL